MWQNIFYELLCCIFHCNNDVTENKEKTYCYLAATKAVNVIESASILLLV